MKLDMVATASGVRVKVPIEAKIEKVGNDYTQTAYSPTEPSDGPVVSVTGSIKRALKEMKKKAPVIRGSSTKASRKRNKLERQRRKEGRKHNVGH